MFKDSQIMNKHAQQKSALFNTEAKHFNFNFKINYITNKFRLDSHQKDQGEVKLIELSSAVDFLVLPHKGILKAI